MNRTMNHKLSKWSLVGVVALGAMMAVAPVKASDPVGVYALVERVVFEPNDSAPTGVQIWGAFALSVTPEKRPYPPEEGYGAAQKGYLYYTCPAGKSAQCTAEWKDLQRMAGGADIAGFGTRWGTAGWPKIRRADEKPASPDVYQLNAGVIRMGKNGEYPALSAALKAALGRK